MSKHGAPHRCPAVGLIALVAVIASTPAGGAVAGVHLQLASAEAPPSTDVDCLAQAIYYEARGESLAGRQAVAQVVLNRLHSPLFPKTVCSVVFQGAERSSGCQFTFTCDGSRARPPEADAWQDAQAVAADALAGRVPSIVGASTHYHAVWMRPGWSLAMTPTLQIGGHRFYVDGARGGRLTAPMPVVQLAAAAPAEFSVWGLRVALVTPTAAGAANVTTP